MGDSLKVKLNLAGLREVRTSPQMQEVLKERAEQVADKANASFAPSEGEDGYVVKSTVGKTRARAKVVPGSAHAAKHNARHNTLIKALGGGL